jgi:PhzF family phenazine biosynthesis protein
MKLPMWQVDAFASGPFTGNPAAVVVCEQWPEDGLMQAIAFENNLSETAFVVREEQGWRVRWFTPQVEVELCGHGTLSAAWVVLEKLEPGADKVTFASRSGPLPVHRDGRHLVLDFPANRPRPAVFPTGIETLVGTRVMEVHATSGHLMVVVGSPEAVEGLRPVPSALSALSKPSLIVTAEGKDCDFVSRYFRKDLYEDPATGSAHCVLAPFWGRRLSKDRLSARQLSRRGGWLEVENKAERVLIGGVVRPFFEGVVTL